MAAGADHAPRTLRWLGVAGVLVLGCALIAFFARTVGMRSWLFAFELHFVLMAVGDSIHRLLKPRLESSWFDVAPGELPVYRALGVHGFRHMLQAIGWNVLNRNRRVFDGTRRTLASYEQATRAGEWAHAWLFAAALLPLAWCLWRGWWDGAFWIGSMSVLFHAYPVMLQRTQRWRLRALLARARPA